MGGRATVGSAGGLRDTVIPDVNVLVYAVNQQAEQHERALEWLSSSLNGPGTVGFSWTVLNGFLRLCLHPNVLEHPLDASSAFLLLKQWIEADNALIVEPGPGHLGVYEELLQRVGGSARLLTDAHLAAIAIEHGSTLASFDSDFHRFAELRFEFLGAR